MKEIVKKIISFIIKLFNFDIEETSTATEKTLYYKKNIMSNYVRTRI